ncbi:hypothetical protein EOM82_08490, partial [bacterium]|nr:hypothetical protein [bacterium]
MAKKEVKKVISVAEENSNIKKVVPRTVRPAVNPESASLPAYAGAKPEDLNKEIPKESVRDVADKSATSDGASDNTKSEMLIDKSETIIELYAEDFPKADSDSYGQSEEPIIIINEEDDRASTFINHAKNNESKELAEMRKRLAELESTQAELIRQQSAVKDAWAARIDPVKSFFKKHGRTVILPLSLMLAFLITILISFVGVRGIYVSVENSNRYIIFTPSSYTYSG